MTVVARLGGDRAAARSGVRLGLRANWRQFWLLVLINAFVGAMVGLERTVVPLLAEREFGLGSASVILSFLVTFGLVKALANLGAGTLADTLGRRTILIAGWVAAVPIPFLILLAPTWGWIVAANALLGINQGLCWSATVIMKIDLVGPQRRGVALGLNEFAGYLAVAAAALGTGYFAGGAGLRSVLFYPGLGLAAVGLLSSALLVRDTTEHARVEAAGDLSTAAPAASARLRFAQVFAVTTWRNRSLFAASQAGLVNNLNDAAVWGLVPLVLSREGMSLSDIGLVAATYPAVWGMSQLLTGALSDVWGRKRMIAGGMWVQAAGIGLFVAGRGRGFGQWMAGAVLLGLGTAMVYPTLLAAVADQARPQWRATAVGVYRLWRDGGYAVGGLCAGLLADALGKAAALGTVAGLTALSGLVVATTMDETRG